MTLIPRDGAVHGQPRRDEGTSARALQFTILTGLRAAYAASKRLADALADQLTDSDFRPAVSS